MFYVTEYDAINTCNCISVFVSFVFFVYELVQLKDKGYHDYFSKRLKIVDFFMFAVLCCYAKMRWNDTSNMLPDIYYEEMKKDPNMKFDLDQNIWRTVFNIFLVMAFALKFTYLMRINPKFGLLNQMIEQVFSDVVEYTQLFLGWVIVYAILSRILGSNNTNINAYSLKLNPFGAYFCQSWLNVTGNSDGPTYFFWAHQSNIPNQTSFWPNFIIFLCWLVWIANSVSMNVMMLNILIAIVFESFATCMNSLINRKYSQRCEMNRECRLILEMFNMNPNRDVFILSALSNKDDDKWNGFVKNINEFIKEEVYNTSEVLKKGKKEVSKGLTDFRNQVQDWLKLTETKVIDNSQK